MDNTAALLIVSAVWIFLSLYSISRIYHKNNIIFDQEEKIGELEDKLKAKEKYITRIESEKHALAETAENFAGQIEDLEKEKDDLQKKLDQQAVTHEEQMKKLRVEKNLRINSLEAKVYRINKKIISSPVKNDVPTNKRTSWRVQKKTKKI